jgi:hypothetical protein
VSCAFEETDFVSVFPNVSIYIYITSCVRFNHNLFLGGLKTYQIYLNYRPSSVLFFTF